MKRRKPKAKRPNWRKEAKKAMLKAARHEAQKNGWGAEPSFNYRWEHVKAVVSVALKLADLVGADAKVVEAAAWLHDVAKIKGRSHARAGARYARSFLVETDFPSSKIDHVAQAIDQHIGLWRDEPLTDLEAMVLWDADKLTKLGLTAAIHFTGMFMSGAETLSTEDLIERARGADWQSRAVDSMHTKPARKAARKRLKRYHRMWQDLEAELAGRDIK